jgi:dihydroorotate dehydrogenase electron transfer subunit
MARCGEGFEMLLRRPLSVHRITGDCLSFLIAEVGRGTVWLAKRKPGDLIDLFGPLGNGFEIHTSSSSLLLVAGGIGVAPLVALAEHAVARGCSVSILMGDVKQARIYPERFIPSGVKTVVATEDGSLGTKGMVTDLLTQFTSSADQVFACGPLPMYRAIARMRSRFEGKPVQVSLETVLGCGVGACLGCTIETRHGPKLVCRDGPVFDIDDVIWERMTFPPQREDLAKRRRYGRLLGGR